MSKYSGVLVLTVLGTIGQAVAAEVSVLPYQAVHEENKSAGPLLSEMQQVVKEWTVRCTSKEAASDPNTRQCWYDAVSALTRYVEGTSETLVKRAEQLQATWIERAAQLQQSSTSSPETAAVVSTDIATGIAAAAKQESAPKTVRPKPARRSETTARKKPSQKYATTNPAPIAQEPKAKNLTSNGRNNRNKQREKQALKVVKRSNFNVRPTTVQSPNRTFTSCLIYPTPQTAGDTRTVGRGCQ
jgi:hypothetical protein